jgi:sirohydrochlorin ferrochelatase
MSKNVDAVVLLGHGSRVAPANAPLVEMAELVSHRLGGCKTVSAYLQLAEPLLGPVVEQLVAEGAKKIVIMPFFLFPGAHVREDIPEELERLGGLHPDVEMILAGHLGIHALLADIAAQRIEEVTV